MTIQENFPCSLTLFSSFWLLQHTQCKTLSSKKFFFNPNQTGLFGQSKSRGEGGGNESKRRIFESYAHNGHPNLPQMVPNDILDLFPFMQSLKTILWFTMFPKCGAKITLSGGIIFSAFSTKFLKIYHFSPILTIYTSNESWNHSKLIFDVEKYSLIKKFWVNWTFQYFELKFLKKKFSDANFSKYFHITPKIFIFLFS